MPKAIQFQIKYYHIATCCSAFKPTRGYPSVSMVFLVRWSLEILSRHEDGTWQKNGQISYEVSSARRNSSFFYNVGFANLLLPLDQSFRHDNVTMLGVPKIVSESKCKSRDRSPLGVPESPTKKNTSKVLYLKGFFIFGLLTYTIFGTLCFSRL